MSNLLEVKDLSLHYKTALGMVRAVDDVTFDLKRKQSIGIAGESGSGKTTVASAIMNILAPNAKIVKGEIIFDGENLLDMDSELFRTDVCWKRISMVFQGAMNALNPIIKVGEQVAETITIHENTSEEEAWERGGRLFEMVGLPPERIYNYPFEFSGGMRQRAIIAMALACSPDLIIADEPTTALDVTIQAQIMNLLTDLQKTLNLSIILITHDMSVIAETCEEAVIMYAGKIVEKAPVEHVFTEPMHPYSEGLVNAIPSLAKAKTKMLSSIPGSPPNLLYPPSGCRFHPRCEYAKDICKREDPELLPYRGNKVMCACHFAER
ncbi:MAG: ABC transporter ATP-binding protein [Candidatus Hodarchaeales archaeon]|jgi:peptide/nickel transport system ATP-binding protein